MSVTLEYVEPRFGFVTEKTKPKRPTGRPIRVFTTRPYFVSFKDGEDKKAEPLNAVVYATQVSPGIMVVVCEGRRGGGFYICHNCGAGFQHLGEIDSCLKCGGTTRKRQEPGKCSKCGGEMAHKTPSGLKCSARSDSFRRVMLGHELLTDVLKLQFQLPPPSADDSTWLAFGLAYALVEGAAERLDVPSSDLNATVTFARDQALAPLVLFDNVPGGAGLVARLETKEMLKACLETARERVSGKCGCRAEDSCYGCLRNYRNQFAHPHLKRGHVFDYLSTILANW